MNVPFFSQSSEGFSCWSSAYLLHSEACLKWRHQDFASLSGKSVGACLHFSVASVWGPIILCFQVSYPAFQLHFGTVNRCNVNSTDGKTGLELDFTAVAYLRHVLGIDASAGLCKFNFSPIPLQQGNNSNAPDI